MRYWGEEESKFAVFTKGRIIILTVRKWVVRYWGNEGSRFAVFTKGRIIILARDIEEMRDLDLLFLQKEELLSWQGDEGSKEIIIILAVRKRVVRYWAVEKEGWDIEWQLEKEWWDIE